MSIGGLQYPPFEQQRADQDDEDGGQHEQAGDTVVVGDHGSNGSKFSNSAMCMYSQVMVTLQL